jgi:hypothetical protein
LLHFRLDEQNRMFIVSSSFSHRLGELVMAYEMI